MFKISYVLLLLSSVSSVICMNGGWGGSVNLNSKDPESANSSFIDGQTYPSTPHFPRSVSQVELPRVVPDKRNDVIYILVGCLYVPFVNDARGIFPYNPSYFNNIPAVYPYASFNGNAPYNPFYFNNIPVDSDAFSKEGNSSEGESFSDETGGVSSDNFRCQSAPLPEGYNTAYRRREGSCPPVFFSNESTRYEDSAAAGDYVKGDGPLIEKEPPILNKSEPQIEEGVKKTCLPPKLQAKTEEASLSVDSETVSESQSLKESVYSLEDLGIKDNDSISLEYANKFNISNTLKSFIASSVGYSRKVCKFLEILDQTSLFADVDFASYLADGDLDGSNVFELLNKLSSVIGSKFKTLSVSTFYDGDLDLELLFRRPKGFLKVLHEELCPNNLKKKKLKKIHGTLVYRNLFVQLFHDLIADVFDERIPEKQIDFLTNGFFCILEICANGPKVALERFLSKNIDGLSHKGIDFIRNINIKKRQLFRQSTNKIWKAGWYNNQDRVFLNFAYKDKDGKLKRKTSEHFVIKVYQALFDKMLTERSCFFNYSYEDDVRHALSIAINFDENECFTLENLTCTVEGKRVFPVEYVVLFDGADKYYIDQNYKERRPLIGRIERDYKARLIRYIKPVDSNMIFYITCNFHIFWNVNLLNYLEREQFSISVAEAMTPNREYIDNIIFSKGE